MTEEKKPKLNWSIMEVWNDMLEREDRKPKVRKYITFSDLGKDYWNRYQKMMGVKPTNPFENRVLRIFSAGHEFHNLMTNVFKAAGIFKNSQDDLDDNGKKQWSVIQETEKTMKVLGKYDCLAGGVPKVDDVKTYCEQMGFSVFIRTRTIKIAEKVYEKYPNGLSDLLYEFKSINSMAFWNKKDYLQEAYPHHGLQLYGYLKANNLPKGRLLYISKDDLVIQEFEISYPDQRMEIMLKSDLESMTNFIKNKIEPPKPANVVFNPRKKLRFQRNKKKIIIVGCYEPNWEIERSLYFTLMTGYKKTDEWKETIKPELKLKNEEIKTKYLNK